MYYVENPGNLIPGFLLVLNLNGKTRYNQDLINSNAG